jgi:hypothetical protein
MYLSPCGEIEGYSLVLGVEKIEPNAVYFKIPTQTTSWMNARAQSRLKGTPKTLEVMTEGHKCATAMLLETKFGLREMPLMFEPSDFTWSDEAALLSLIKLFVAKRKPFFLERLPKDSPTLQALQKVAKGKFWLRVEPAVPTPYIDTQFKTINDLVKSGRRSDLRRSEKSLAKFGTISYELRAPNSKKDCDKLISEAFDVEARSWKHTEGTALSSPDEASYAAAFRSFLENAYEEGHIRFAFVRLDGKAVAMQIASEWQNRYWIYKATFDKDYSKGSPGNLLYYYTLEQAVQQGLLSYEFMGSVDTWTSAWTQDVRQYVKVYGIPYNPRGLIGAIAVVRWIFKSRTNARKAAKN